MRSRNFRCTKSRKLMSWALGHLTMWPARSSREPLCSIRTWMIELATARPRNSCCSRSTRSIRDPKDWTQINGLYKTVSDTTTNKTESKYWSIIEEIIQSTIQTDISTKDVLVKGYKLSPLVPKIHYLIFKSNFILIPL